MNKTKQKYSQTENKAMVTRGERSEREGQDRGRGSRGQTVRYKINKIQRYNVQYRVYNQYFTVIKNEA